MFLEGSHPHRYLHHQPSFILSSLKSVSFERLYDIPPSYSSLCVFGCVCFVLLQPHERYKLEHRSHLCCFLGHEIKHKGYRCWDPIFQRLRISHHVVLWEHTTFNSLSKFKACSTLSFFTNPSLPLFPPDIFLDLFALLPIPHNDSLVSSLEPPLPMDPVIDQNSPFPPTTPHAFSLTTPPADFPISPQEFALPVDHVTDQTPHLPLRRSNRVRAPPAHLHDFFFFFFCCDFSS
jgi:hypothetical protein